MTSRRRTLALAIGFGCLYLTALGFLAGVVAERLRFDAARSSVLRRLTSAEHLVRARLMDLERETMVVMHAGERGALGRDEPLGKPGF